VTLYRVETPLVGSEAHGNALNEMVGRIATPYGAIIDADALFLLKDWDQLLIDRMNEQNVPIYGTQAGPRGKKPPDFPMIFGVIFKTDIMQSLDVDFRPKDREINRFQDTGWEMRKRYLLEKNIKGGLLYNFNTRDHKRGPFATVVC